MLHSETAAPLKISPAISVLIFFALGIIVDRYFDICWLVSLGLSIVFVFAWTIGYSWKSDNVAVVSLLMAFLFTGAFWHHGRWNWFPENDLIAYCDVHAKPICLKAKIVGEGRLSLNGNDRSFDALPAKEKTTFQILPSQIRNGMNWESVGGRCRLIVYGECECMECGDDVLILGNLAKLRQPTTPGNFDAQGFHRAHQLTCSVHAYFAAAVTQTCSSSRISNASLRSDLREHFNEQIWAHLDDDQAGFASAILLGNREQIPREARQSFLTTGTAHLLAISGLHVGILASLFLFLYRGGLVRRNQALLATVLFVCFYAWLVEFRPPVVRATILVSLFCMGKLIGRKGLEFNLLAVAGFIVLAINPSDLFHLGPQLSFLAVSTLVVFKDWIIPVWSSDPIDRLIRNSRPWHARVGRQFGLCCRQMFLVSFVIWLIGLPLVASNFHLVTPIAVVINPIVILPVAIALFSGLGVCVFGGWANGLASLLGTISSYCLEFTSQIIQYAGELPKGHWWTAGPVFCSIVVFYTGFLLLSAATKENRNKLLLGWAAIWILFGWLLPFQAGKYYLRRFQTDSACTFVDVGHGSSVLLQLPYGKTILYDAGSMSSSVFAAETVSNLLWSQQIEHLDAVIISHSDLDHFNAIPELAERFSMGAVYVSVPMFEKTSETNTALFRAIRNQGIPIRVLAWGDHVQLPMSALRILMPPECGIDDTDNSNSVVLLMETDGLKILLPGDLERRGMHLLLQSAPPDCDWVMLPHHGSKNSRPRDFVDWCGAETAVVSVGHSKLDPSVLRSVRHSGCRVHATAELGTIRCEFRNRKPRFANYSDGQWTEIRR